MTNVDLRKKSITDSDVRMSIMLAETEITQLKREMKALESKLNRVWGFCLLMFVLLSLSLLMMF